MKEKVYTLLQCMFLTANGNGVLSTSVTKQICQTNCSLNLICEYSFDMDHSNIYEPFDELDVLLKM